MIEAMKQALETFEAVLGTLTAANEQGVITDTIWFSEHETLFDYIVSEADALRTAIAEAEKQEPVTTVQCIDGVTIGYLEVRQAVGAKLYNTPIPTQRPPLSFAQVCEIEEVVTRVAGRFSLLRFARAIEAAHGITGEKT